MLCCSCRAAASLSLFRSVSGEFCRSCIVSTLTNPQPTCHYRQSRFPSISMCRSVYKVQTFIPAKYAVYYSTNIHFVHESSTFVCRTRSFVFSGLMYVCMYVHQFGGKLALNSLYNKPECAKQALARAYYAGLSCVPWHGMAWLAAAAADVDVYATTTAAAVLLPCRHFCVFVYVMCAHFCSTGAALNSA